MSNQFDSGTLGMAVVFVFIGLAAVGMFYLLAVYAAVLSIICFFALFGPIKIGRFTITPKEARGFLLRGMAGLLLAPLVTIVLAINFKFRIQPEWMNYICVGGYILASVGVQYVLQQLGEPAPTRPPMIKDVTPARPEVARKAAPKPFEFASWDDEDPYK